MGKPLRKQITLEVLGEEIRLDVTHRVIAVLEEVYDQSLDYVIQWELAVPMRVKRSKVAEAIATWISVAGKFPDGMKRREVLDYVMGSDSEELNRFIGALQAAALYCTRDTEGNPRVDDEDFATLLLGKPVDLSKKKRANGEAEGDGEKKAPAAPTSGQSTSSPAAVGE